MIRQLSTQSPGTAAEPLKKFDIVRIGDGSQMIVTEVKLNRPANPYCGVLVNGQGAQYKFGPKHRPVKIGEAKPDHPALMALASRNGDKVGATQLTPAELLSLQQLALAVSDSDLAMCRVYVHALRRVLGG